MTRAAQSRPCSREPRAGPFRPARNQVVNDGELCELELRAPRFHAVSARHILAEMTIRIRWKSLIIRRRGVSDVREIVDVIERLLLSPFRFLLADFISMSSLPG